MKRSRELGEEIDHSRDIEDTEQFLAGNSNLPIAKSLLLDSDTEAEGSHGNTMRCSLPPHREPLAFQSYQEYETHYNTFHTNRCLECRKNFPSEHLLSVHIEESHDPLVRIKRDKGEHTSALLWQKDHDAEPAPQRGKSLLQPTKTTNPVLIRPDQLAKSRKPNTTLMRKWQVLQGLCQHYSLSLPAFDLVVAVQDSQSHERQSYMAKLCNDDD
ncbi:hypothetical protein E4U42_001627 [Claviceps africana]|uniref:C2H2-type domain-containing protein n=1 Tax=Claviceps africana TaxID=83212 RepID=A0A8K0JDG7_9HYPO|nr:hypothetical protein E4U42_001627 [Claviceps africana]